MRQHIGEPLGSQQRAAVNGQRVMNDELRTTSNDPRATTCVRRVTSRWAASGGVGRPSARRQATRAGRRASSGGRRFAGNEQRRRRAKNCRPRGLQTQVTCSGLTSRWCRPQPGCGGSHDPLTAAAYRRAVGQTTGDDNEPRATGFGLPPRRRGRREANGPVSDERRPEEHESGQRAAFNGQRSGEWQVASGRHAPACSTDPERQGVERRATSTSPNAATGDACSADTERRGDARRATSTTHGEATGGDATRGFRNLETARRRASISLAHGSSGADDATARRTTGIHPEETSDEGRQRAVSGERRSATQRAERACPTSR